jgi:hypothetical protein
MKEIIMIEKVREHFRINYGYINLYSIMDRTIENFLSQDYIINLPFNIQMARLYDYILSQDMCDIQE